MDPGATARAWRTIAGCLAVLAPFVWSSWYLDSGIATARNAGDLALSTEAFRADLNRLAALENAAEAGEDFERAEVRNAAVGLRSNTTAVSEALPMETRERFTTDVDEYIAAATDTAFDFLDGEDDAAELDDEDDAAELDDEVTDPLYSRLLAQLDGVRETAMRNAEYAAHRESLGLVLGALGVLSSLTLIALLVGRRHARAVAVHTHERTSLRYQALIEDSTDQIYVLDRVGNVDFISPSAKRILGDITTIEEFAEATGTDPRLVIKAMQAHPGGRPMEVKISVGDSYRWYAVSMSDQLDRPEVRGIVVVARDITREIRLREELREQATTDDLTGLPNRRAVRTALDAASARAWRSNSDTALLLIDLDGFKGVNDTLGHPIGDELLRQVGRRLARVARSGETVGRLGGDEFAAIAEGIGPDRRVDAMGARLLEALSSPFEIGDHLLSISGSIGAVVGTAGGDVDALFRRADIALYEAKRAGRNRTVAFEPAMEERVMARSRIQSEMSAAQERDEFHLEYQPVVSGAGLHTAGFEALMRWNSPELGLVSPVTFIPVAEQTGAIIPLGRWALHEACQRLAAWQQLTGDPTLTMSVNASVVQLETLGFVDDVTAAVRLAGIDPHCLQVEVTESIVVSDSQTVMSSLEAIRELGVRVALDDFGTGYSSMSQLQALPVDCLKIDRAFVKVLDASHDKNRRVVVAMIELANAFGLSVIAEGVEEIEQLEILRRAGCRRFQGYYFSRPLPAERVVEFLGIMPAQPVAMARLGSADHCDHEPA